MRKKFFGLLLIAVMLFSAFTVLAEEKPVFVVETASAKAGETVDVTIRVKNNPGIASIKLSVTYDENLMLNSVTYNDAIGGMSMQPQKLDSPVTLNWFNGLANTEGDWVFATLSFSVSDGILQGTYPITVTYEADNVYNIVENNIAFDVENGAVIVECAHTNKTEVPSKSAECVNSGNNLYYTCSCGKVFKADGVTETTAEEEIIPALGHDLSEASCSAPVTCKHGCGYTEDSALGHDWTEKIEDAAHLKDAPKNCISVGSYWYDCSRCDAVSIDEYFSGTTAGDHSFTEKIEDEGHLASDGDCQTVKSYFYNCEYCETIGAIAWESTVKGDHELDSMWTTENGVHSHKCTVEGCDYRTDEAACAGGTVTCTEKAVCSTCGAAYGNFAEHEYKTEWNQGDETGHWHECKNCTARDNIEVHVPGEEATMTTPQTCMACGYVIKAALGHIHVTTKIEGYAETCTEAGQKSYYACTCGKWFEDAAAEKEINDHSNVLINPAGHIDADKNEKCDVCNYAMSPETPSTPSTGDNNNILLWVCAMVIGGVVFVNGRKRSYSGK